MKKFLYNHFIWIGPEFMFFSLLFGVIFFIILCGSFFSTWYHVDAFPSYAESYEVKGRVKEFYPQSSGSDYHIEITMEDGEKYYIIQSMRKAYSWNRAVHEITPGTYVEMMVINEGADHDPRVVALSYSGKAYLSFQVGKRIHQHSTIESGECSQKIFSGHVIEKVPPFSPQNSRNSTNFQPFLDKFICKCLY